MIFLELLNDNMFQFFTSEYVGKNNVTFHCENRNARSFINHIIVLKSYCDMFI